MKLIGMIADHPTPKINAEDGVAYTLNSRDYKGVMIVALRFNAVERRNEDGSSQDNDRPTNGISKRMG